MPRPQRRRRVCSEPEYNEFIPMGSAGNDIVVLSTDEYEAIRLVDFEKKLTSSVPCRWTYHVPQ